MENSDTWRTTIVANHWAIHLDEKTYKDPEKFIPERFIDPQSGQLIGTKWSTYGHHAFGFGRRICPALHIANKSLFITFTRILWSFNIKTQESNLMSPEEFIKSIKFSTGFSSHPIDLNKSGSIEIIPRDPFSTLKTLWSRLSRIMVWILLSYHKPLPPKTCKPI
ncbi:hypothetical protein Pst134EA_032555 [Puccinia striiformis f. sp. tritici]|uniref:uncharacterized protein n=1 Tax=Puccinia striiformis f. sp. tritici TaxID=168172 RepID=UPI0020077214|nr:uncharacterized protein Pst134EA_032555 [Puccinia striiformis f. sp. tritici]KAH9443608.1 hypothetical protein Pst134EA_032555 [Puccinia striiformis f. sp. tritici]